MSNEIDDIKAELLFNKTTQEEWKLIGDSYNPPEWFICASSPEAIAGPSEPMDDNPDYEWIVYTHKHFMEMINEIRRLRQWKREAMMCLNEWSKVHDAAGKPGSLGMMTPRATADRVIKLMDFARQCRDNYDCDSDHHDHGISCRCCSAEEIIGPK